MPTRETTIHETRKKNPTFFIFFRLDFMLIQSRDVDSSLLVTPVRVTSPKFAWLRSVREMHRIGDRTVAAVCAIERVRDHTRARTVRSRQPRIRRLRSRTPRGIAATARKSNFRRDRA